MPTPGAGRDGAATSASASAAQRRHVVLARLGIEPPTIGTLARSALDAAIMDAEGHSPGTVTVLDAGCGRNSYLVPFRRRIDRFVGVDTHVVLGAAGDRIAQGSPSRRSTILAVGRKPAPA